jgi:hypothetical protein
MTDTCGGADGEAHCIFDDLPDATRQRRDDSAVPYGVAAHEKTRKSGPTRRDAAGV